VTATTTSNGKPLLDADSFQKLLAAAFVLQEHNDQLQSKPADRVNGESRKPTEAADILDTAHLSPETVPANYTQTLGRIVATQQQIHMEQLNLQEALNLIAERALQLTGAGGTAVGLMEQQKLVYRAASGSATTLLGTEVDLDSSLSARCLATGESIQCANADSANHIDAGLCRKTGIKAIIAVPIFYQGKVSGSIELRSASPNAFHEHDVRTCQLMAGLVTEAMARAAEMEWKQALTAERATMLEALDRLNPQLQRLAGEPEFRDERRGGSVGAAGAAVAPAMDDLTPCIGCGNFLEADQLFCGQCGTERPSKKRGDLQSKWASMWERSQTSSPGSAPESPAKAWPGSAGEWESIVSGLDTSADGSDLGQPSVADSSLQSGAAFQPQLATVAGTAEQVVDPALPNASPWGSATKAKNWLDLQRKKGSGGALIQLWKSRRADIYLGLAVILVIVALPWIIWSKPSTPTSGSSNPVVASADNPANGASPRRKKPPEPKLSMMEQLLVSMGLAEPPPVPVYTGNPNTRVWVDLHTALYYCPGTDLYGKTPKGKFTNQRDAQMDQFEPAYRRACD
jgi:putative methionine-R-sulfoxide reductase with GAF domain